MYRDPSDYDEMAKLAIAVRVDYQLNEMPLDMEKVCQKIGIPLIAYSDLEEEKQKFLIKIRKNGFYQPPTCLGGPAIFYNDFISSKGKQRYTIGHELKHYVNNDKEESKKAEDMAEYWSKYFIAPSPYWIYYRITDTNEIMTKSGLSEEAASYVKKGLRNRIKKFGYKFFNYEIPLLELMVPDFKIENVEIVNKERK